MAETLDFESALRKVISELKAPKGQYNSFGKYKYRNAEDIQEAVKPLLDKYKLRMKLSDTIINKGDRYYIEATVTVKGYGESDTATGEAREAESKKGMDEAQITGAASSYARKYALNGMFDIDDTKDADSNEQREHVKNAPAILPEYATEAQKQRIAKLLTADGIMVSEIPSILQEHYDLPVGTVMTYEKAELVIKELGKTEVPF